MKNKSRILALFVSIAMIMGMIVPSVVYAADLANVKFDINGIEEEALPDGFQLNVELNDGSFAETKTDSLTITDLTEGSYIYTITATDYCQTTGTFDITAEDLCNTKNIQAYFVKPDTEVNVNFNISPEEAKDNAKIYIDDEEVTLPKQYKVRTSHTYKIVCDGYEEQSSSFDVLDYDTVVDVTLNERFADYSKLDSKIAWAESILGDKFTEASYNEFKNAVNAAKAVDRKLNVTKQSVIDKLADDIDAAYNALVSVVELTPAAVAVSNDLSVKDGAADSIKLIFNEPTNGADIMQYLTVDSGSLGNSSGSWNSDNTVYTITLKDSELTNGAKLTYNANEDVTALKNSEGSLVKEFSAVIAGNLEGIGSLTAPTDMTAIIVKGSSRPTASNGDKIVVVFNAPINEPISAADFGISADCTVSADTTKTVYTIELSDNNSGLDDNSVITYKELTAKLSGSFGTATVPKLIKVTAVDTGANPKVDGDKLLFSFDAPTNKAEIAVPDYAGTGASVQWINSMLLELKIGEGASLKADDKIGLDGLGIKDEYSLVDAQAPEMDITGSFGEVNVPELINAIIIDKDNTANTVGDEIRFVFSTTTNGKAVDLSRIKIGTADVTFGNNSSAEWNDEKTILTVTLGSTAKVTNNMKLDLSQLGIMDEYEIENAIISEINVKGSFGITLMPRVTKAVAFTQGGSDIIRIYFNTEVKEQNGNDIQFAILNGSEALELGDGYKAEFANSTSKSGAYFTITLGKNHGAFSKGNYSIKFYSNSDNKIVDVETGSFGLVEDEAVITGTFVEAVKPELVNVTAISNDGSGVSKKDDVLYAVFNTEVKLGTVEAVNGSLGAGSSIAYGDKKNIVKIILGENSDVVPGTTKLIFKNFVDLATGTAAADETAKEISGSFGEIIKPELLRVTAVSNDGSGVAKKGDVIYAVFNTEVKLGTVEASGLGTGYKVEYGDTQNVVKVTLGDGASITVGTDVTFKGFKSVSTEETIADITKELGGSFGEYTKLEVTNAIAVSSDGSGIPKSGDKVYITFNKALEAEKASYAVNGIEIGKAENAAENVAKITLNENASQAKIGAEIKISGAADKLTGIVSDLTAKLEGSYGNKENAKVISVVAISNDGSGVAKKGDTISVVFDRAVTKDAAAQATIGGQSIGTVELDASGYILTITLTEDGGVKTGDILKLTGLKDKATGEELTDTEKEINGSFGEIIKPELLRVTAVSNDGSGVAKKGDVIYAVFNTEVKLGTVEASGLGTGYKVEYGDTQNVVKVTLGDGASITVGTDVTFKGFKSVSTEETIADITKELGGSFGEYTKLEVTNAIAVSSDGSGIPKSGDKVYITFNKALEAEKASYAVNGIEIGKAENAAENVAKITLNENASQAKIGAEIKISGAADKLTGIVSDLTAKLEGSYGNKENAKVISVVAISNDGSGVAKKGDTISVVFDRAVTKDAAAQATIGGQSIGTVELDASGYILTITLTEDGKVSVGSKLNVTGIKDKATGDAIAVEEQSIGGSFGIAEKAKINRAYIYGDDSGTYIEIIFNKEIKFSNPEKANISSESVLGKLVGEAKAEINGTTLKIKLAENAPIDLNRNTINITELGIVDAHTGETPGGIDNIKIDGTVVPYVISATSECIDNKGHIKIKFSSRVNTEGTDLSAMVTLLGIGAKADWNEIGTELDITLGKDYSINANGYLSLSAMGLKSYYGGTPVTGQCKLVGSFSNSKLEVLSIMASSDDVKSSDAQKGDKVTVYLSGITNHAPGDISNIEDIAEVGTLVSRGEEVTPTATPEATAAPEATDAPEATEEPQMTITELLGTGASVTWAEANKFIITLGEKPQLVIGDTIKFKGLSFAGNADSEIDSSKENVVDGSFDGRDIKITEVSVSKTKETTGDWRITADIRKVKETDVAPTVVCIAYNSSGKTVGLYRTTYSVDYAENSSVIYEIPASLESTALKTRIFVFDGELTELNDPTKVLAVPAEAVYTVSK